MNKLTALLGTCLLTSSIAATAAHHNTGNATDAQFDAKIKAYIMNHPEVIMASMQKMQQQQQVQQMEQGKKAAVTHAKSLLNDTLSPAVQSGPVTVVEFFDYQCSVCHMMFPKLEKLMKANPNVRFVFKEFPIFGPASEFAAQASIAARKQNPDLFMTFHDNLFNSGLMEGKLKDKDVLAIAEKSGLNIKQLKVDMASDAVKQEVKNTYKLASDLKLQGTPAFVVLPTDESKVALDKVTFVPGAADPHALQKAIEQAK